MNTNEQDHGERQDMERDDHGLLTASIFGELSAAEQAALDARLANEPELRAQRDALAATAALVRGSFPAGASLPPALLSSLEHAASTDAVSPLLAFPQRTQWLRIAAGLALICGGAIAANEWFGRDRAGAVEREERLAAGERRPRYNQTAGEIDPRPVDSRDRPIVVMDVDDATELKRETYYDIEDPEDYAKVRKHLLEVSEKLETQRLKQGSDSLSAERRAGVELEYRDQRHAGEAGEVGAAARGYGEDKDSGAFVGRIASDEAPAAESATRDGYLPVGQSDNVDRFGKRGSVSTPAGPVAGDPLAGPGSSVGGTFSGPGDKVPPGGSSSSPGSRVFIDGPVVESPAPDPATRTGSAQAESKQAKLIGGGGGPGAPGTARFVPPAESESKLSKSSGPASPGPAGAPVSEVTDSLRALGYTSADDGDEGTDSGRLRREVRYDSEAADDLEVELGLGERKRDFSGRRIFTAAELDALAAARSEQVLRACRRLPDERPNMMFFRFYGDNAFELAHIDPQSTFGADVDTASYTLARRYLRDGLMPEKAQIRTEEFVNYFKPDLAPPAADSKVPFAVHTELGVSRFGRDRWASESTENADRWMLRVGVRGKEVAREERQPLQLTFVVDTSGSMKEGGRMELVKHALRLLVTELDARDSIALVAFSNEARQVLPMTSAANRGLIETAIHGLNPNGGTNAEAGLRMGYETAGMTLAPGNHSRVVLLSDGVANIGQTDQDRVNEDVRKQRERGIYLNTVGVGMGNHNDTFLEQLANKGDGLCNYVDDEREARRALVENFTGAFETIARDLKVQVEFDPSQVYRYRLLGYENRAIADVDFRNDKVDAGEIGAGHQVVALYELELTGNASEAPLAQVRVRWKAPTGAGRHPSEDVAAGELDFPVQAANRKAWESASLGFQRDTCVAQFAEILRRSVHARGDSLDELIAQSAQLDAQLRDPDFAEFVDMLRAGRNLIVQHAPRTSDLTDCIDALRRNRILRAQVEELRRDQSAALLSDLEQQNAQLELRIRDLIRQELEQELK